MRIDDELICNGCWASVKIVQDSPVKKSGLKIHVYGFFEGTLRDAIHLLKYRQRTSLTKRLSQLMCEALREEDKYELIVFVPLHFIRQWWRGYNQSELLAREVSKNLRIPVSCGNLIRSKYTKSQTRLPENKRYENVKGAFRVKRPDEIFGKKILLIDDVSTTGATLGACSEALKDAGAKEVFGLVVAMA